ncbi:hypothetical protein JB92DRAFT_606732 [Gautieria morchelliformis]|nr:hypothetical protein JB92DRAFT_606732 [Gautieria morchelliformis]
MLSTQTSMRTFPGSALDLRKAANSDEPWEPKSRKRSLQTKRIASLSETPKSKSKTRKQVAVKISSKASILSLASNIEPGRQDSAERLASVDSAVLGKIKKALSLGGHQATGEAEAKRAMRVATKLMAQHNVDQADILSAEQDSEKLKRAGQSSALMSLIQCRIVTVKSTNPKQGVVIHTWSSRARYAMEIFFDCKSYSTSIVSGRSTKRVDITFYGLCEQTVAAACAFEMVYNLVLNWSAQNKKAKGRSAKNAYCHGVGDGLVRLAKQEKREEERLTFQKETRRLENAREAEEQERKRAIARLTKIDSGDSGVKKEASDETPIKVKEESIQVKVEEVPDQDIHSQGTSRENLYHVQDDSDDDSNDFGHGGPGDPFEAEPDFQDKGDDDIDWMLHELEDGVKPSIDPVKKEEDTPWTSAQQLTLFRNNASAIADDYLKQNNIKLRKGSRRTGPNLNSWENRQVYDQGCNDAKNIDIKRKRIKDVDDE